MLESKIESLAKQNQKNFRWSDSRGRIGAQKTIVEPQEIVAFRVTPDDIAIIDAAATSRGMTRSRLFKIALWQYLGQGEESTASA